MPREGKPFEVFQQEDQQCREFAANAIKDTSNAALKEGATSAAIGAALGAAAGAVIQGGSSQNIGTGAGIGLLGGAAMGAMNSSGKQIKDRLNTTLLTNNVCTPKAIKCLAIQRKEVILITPLPIAALNLFSKLGS